MKKIAISLSLALLLAACGGGRSEPQASNEEPSPAVEATPEAPPLPDTVPLKEAKKGELIALPFYPGVGRYGGTADLRGMKTFEMGIPIIKSVHTFSPNVLIGSPGQEIRLTGFDEGSQTDIQQLHNFRISETAEFRSEHEVLDDWPAHKGTKGFTVTFPQEGSIAFYCSYHVRINMAGMLIVRD